MMDISNPITAGVVIIAIGAVLILSQVISDLRFQNTTVTLQSGNPIRFRIIVVIGTLIIGIGCFAVISEAGRDGGPNLPTPVPSAPPEPPHLTRGTFTFPTNGQNVSGTFLLARAASKTSRRCPYCALPKTARLTTGITQPKAAMASGPPTSA